MIITEEQLLKLDRAAGLMAEVQLELLRKEEQDTQSSKRGYWHELYRVRASLTQCISTLKEAKI